MFRTIEISDPRFEVDGLRWITVKSPSLRGRGDITVWAPEAAEPAGLVVLLHGVYGSHWCWALRGGAHRTARRLIEAGALPPVALAMPSDGLRGDGTAFARHADGVDFERWIVEEVPAAARAAMPTLRTDAPLFIAGLSMGGFGALRLGATHARRFHGISGHSSITQVSQMADFIEEDVDTLTAGPDMPSVLDAIAAAGPDLPPVRFDCGSDDPLLAANRALHAALLARGIPHAYEEFPGGHDWPYWETHVEDSFRFVAAILRAAIPPGAEP